MKQNYKKRGRKVQDDIKYEFKELEMEGTLPSPMLVVYFSMPYHYTLVTHYMTTLVNLTIF